MSIRSFSLLIIISCSFLTSFSQIQGTIGLDKTATGDGIVLGISFPAKCEKWKDKNVSFGFGYRLQLHQPLFYHSAAAGPENALVLDSVFAMSSEQNYSIRQKTDYLNFDASVSWMPVHLAKDHLKLGMKGMITAGKLSDMFNVYAGLKEDSWVLYAEPTVAGQVAWYSHVCTISLQAGFSTMISLLEAREVHYQYPYYYYLSGPDMVGGIWSFGFQVSVPLHRK